MLNFEGEFVHVFLRKYVQCVHVRVANIERGVMRVCKYNIMYVYMLVTWGKLVSAFVSIVVTSLLSTWQS